MVSGINKLSEVYAMAVKPCSCLKTPPPPAMPTTFSPPLESAS